MPGIYTYFGFIFSFFSQEHEPIHVHVEHQDRMTIFDLIIVDGDLVEIKKRDKGKPLGWVKMKGRPSSLLKSIGKRLWRNGFRSSSIRNELDVRILKPS